MALGGGAQSQSRGGRPAVARGRTQCRRSGAVEGWPPRVAHGPHACPEPQYRPWSARRAPAGPAPIHHSTRCTTLQHPSMAAERGSMGAVGGGGEEGRAVDGTGAWMDETVGRGDSARLLPSCRALAISRVDRILPLDHLPHAAAVLAVLAACRILGRYVGAIELIP